MAERIVTRVDPVSLAKVLGLIGLVWGVLLAILAIPLGGPGGLTESLFFLVTGPLYGVVGGAITAVVYNFAADVVGGIELDLE